MDGLGRWQSFNWEISHVCLSFPSPTYWYMLQTPSLTCWLDLVYLVYFPLFTSCSFVSQRIEAQHQQDSACPHLVIESASHGGKIEVNLGVKTAAFHDMIHRIRRLDSLIGNQSTVEYSSHRTLLVIESCLPRRTQSLGPRNRGLWRGDSAQYRTWVQGSGNDLQSDHRQHQSYDCRGTQLSKAGSTPKRLWRDSAPTRWKCRMWG